MHESESNLFMRQAPMTTRTWLPHVIDQIDEQFGKGFALQHPELVGQLTIACAIDQHTAHTQSVGHAIESSLDSLAQATDAVASALGDTGRMGDLVDVLRGQPPGTIGEISHALREIAAAIEQSRGKSG